MILSGHVAGWHLGPCSDLQSLLFCCTLSCDWVMAYDKGLWNWFFFFCFFCCVRTVFPWGMQHQAPSWKQRAASSDTWTCCYLDLEPPGFRQWGIYFLIHYPVLDVLLYPYGQARDKRLNGNFYDFIVISHLLLLYIHWAKQTNEPNRQQQTPCPEGLGFSGTRRRLRILSTTTEL